jgi:hypothetical protein
VKNCAERRVKRWMYGNLENENKRKSVGGDLCIFRGKKDLFQF